MYNMNYIVSLYKTYSKRMIYFRLILIFNFFLFIQCNTPSSPIAEIKTLPTLPNDTTNTREQPLQTTNKNSVEEKKEIPCNWDTYLQAQHLINIQTLDLSILVDLKYSTEDNFMHKDMYGCLQNCYLQPDVAQKLVQAQFFLKEINPRLSLLIYDGVRPRSVQQYMWDILDMPIREKVKFVSNPKNGSLHNFGAAVDLTIYHLDSLQPLDMGTPYDYIGVKAWPIKEKLLIKNGTLTKQQVENRKILRKVMTKAKFFNIQTEWWHFNSCYRKKAYQIYSIVEGIP